MSHLLRFGLLLGWLSFARFAGGQSLETYRHFTFGMDIGSVAIEAKVDSSLAKTLYVEPAPIQTLDWNRPSYSGSATDTDPVRRMRFDFFEGRLFKIVVTYGSRQIEGMTPEDLIDAISASYGPGSRVDETIVVSAYTNFEDRQKVIARWENTDFSYSLFQSTFGNEFGLIGYSKKIDAIATAAVQEAKRLDALAAPQREIARRQKQAEEDRLSDEKARTLNKPNFRP